MDVSRDRAFLIPQCFTKDKYFGCFPLTATPTDTQRIKDLDSATRAKKLTEDGASMVRVFEMV